MRRLAAIAAPLVLMAILLAGWETACRVWAIPPFLLPAPSLVGAVVAEFVAGSGGSQGLAWRILEAEHRLETAKMLAALFVLAAMAVALSALLEFFERLILRRWRGR